MHIDCFDVFQTVHLMVCPSLTLQIHLLNLTIVQEDPEIPVVVVQKQEVLEVEGDVITQFHLQLRNQQRKEYLFGT